MFIFDTPILKIKKNILIYFQIKIYSKKHPAAQ
jgi:hypothetical protein